MARIQAYDVIGAGSAGRAVAAGEIEDQIRSALALGAGPSDRWPLVRMPIGWAWLRSHRRDGIHLADASAMPAITSANTNTPSMMIGHRGGQMIAEEAA